MPESPEPASREEIHGRYVDLISENLLLVGEAVHTSVKAKLMLEQVRAGQHRLSAEEVTNAARTWRNTEAAVKKALESLMEAERSFLEFENKTGPG